MEVEASKIHKVIEEETTKIFIALDLELLQTQYRDIYGCSKIEKNKTNKK